MRCGGSFFVWSTGKRRKKIVVDYSSQKQSKNTHLVHRPET
jgi:hypothetical protein